jgi:hypothetical protein
MSVHLGPEYADGKIHCNSTEFKPGIGRPSFATVPFRLRPDWIGRDGEKECGVDQIKAEGRQNITRRRFHEITSVVCCLCGHLVDELRYDLPEAGIYWGIF